MKTPSGTSEVDSAPVEMEIGGNEGDHRENPANPSTLDPTRINGQANPRTKPTFGPNMIAPTRMRKVREPNKQNLFAKDGVSPDSPKKSGLSTQSNQLNPIPTSSRFAALEAEPLSDEITEKVFTDGTKHARDKVKGPMTMNPETASQVSRQLAETKVDSHGSSLLEVGPSSVGPVYLSKGTSSASSKSSQVTKAKPSAVQTQTGAPSTPEKSLSSSKVPVKSSSHGSRARSSGTDLSLLTPFLIPNLPPFPRVYYLRREMVSFRSRNKSSSNSMPNSSF